MHTGQKYALKLGHVYAPSAEVCPKSEARLCTPGRSLSEIRGTFMHTMHRSAPILGQSFER